MKRWQCELGHTWLHSAFCFCFRVCLRLSAVHKWLPKPPWQIVPRNRSLRGCRRSPPVGRLSDLRWPNFTDYRQSTQELYKATNYAAVWIRDGQASPQALAIIAELAGSQKRGLIPEDYDASRWPQRLSALKVSSGNPDTLARFDAALTVCAMRYISDLHGGRVNPKHSSSVSRLTSRSTICQSSGPEKVLCSKQCP